MTESDMRDFCCHITGKGDGIFPRSNGRKTQGFKEKDVMSALKFNSREM